MSEVMISQFKNYFMFLSIMEKNEEKKKGILNGRRRVYASHIIKVSWRKFTSLVITKKFTEPMTEDFCSMAFSSADTVASVWGDRRHALF